MIWGFSGNLPASAQVHGRAVCEARTGWRPPARPGGRLRIPHDTTPRGKQELPPLLIPISTHLLALPLSSSSWGHRAMSSCLLAAPKALTSPKIQLQKTCLPACPQLSNPSPHKPAAELINHTLLRRRLRSRGSECAHSVPRVNPECTQSVPSLPLYSPAFEPQGFFSITFPSGLENKGQSQGTAGATSTGTAPPGQ